MFASSGSARATLLQRGDASRGSSTGSARATLLQRGDASRGSSTESARATLLQRGDAVFLWRLGRSQYPVNTQSIPGPIPSLPTGYFSNTRGSHAEALVVVKVLPLRSRVLEKYPVGRPGIGLGIDWVLTGY